MGAVIDYDLPVLDFIDELSATGHVTHTQHRKTHVTLHHNGGRLSHQGVLDVWKVRPASAAFNVDGLGTVAQFTRVAEYAWATGSTEGNQKSISIEMCNSTVGPGWQVGETTWRSAARLAGWLFAKVIGYRPTVEFLFVHHDWFATACAGPHVDSIYFDILALAQTWYDRFVSGNTDEEEEDDMAPTVYQVNGPVNDEDPNWLTVLVPPVRESAPLPNNGTAKAWVQLGCSQTPLEIWGVYRIFNGFSELVWGPGKDPRMPVDQTNSITPVVLRPDTYKYFELDKKGCTGLSVLYSGSSHLAALVTLTP